ncbi:MAG: Zn-ribbon domain-containing OB-fold protein [Desulfobacterales bacterium]|nr:Zn-ribbon domain-containing OB-fold protein [Desulfobacterales bacterium]
MATVNTKLKQLTVADPLARTPDPWADFRQIEVIELHWEQTYRHSLGKYSRFFIELENQRFYATRCPKCGKVWTPPRPVCPDHLEITEWIQLSGKGRLAGFSVIHYAPAQASFLKPPYVLAYVQLDGADTLFAHLLQNYGDLADIRIGIPVRVVYNKGPVDHPILLMSFEPITK